MTGPSNDEWPAFWFTPWRWAHADWRERYGASVAASSAGMPGQRLLFRGWIDAFGIGREWTPPADVRWFEALAVPRAMMLDAAAVLGWIVLVRAGVMPEAGTVADPRLSRALRYREVSCAEVRLVSSGSEPSDATSCGLELLLAMAKDAWPDVAARVAMLRAPPQPQPRASDVCLVVKGIDAARCMTLWLAVLRWLRAGAGTDS